MYGSTANHDLGFLVGSTLFQACIGENDIILLFDDDISITIQTDFLIRDSSGLETIFEETLPAAASVVKFIPDMITKVLYQRDGTLCLWFSKGGSIEIYDTSEQYESYNVKHGTKIYVV
jgi:Family of unknown function (DUF6188)